MPQKMENYITCGVAPTKIRKHVARDNKEKDGMESDVHHPMNGQLDRQRDHLKSIKSFTIK